MVGHDLIICSRYKSTLLFIALTANGFFLCGERGAFALSLVLHLTIKQKLVFLCEKSCQDLYFIKIRCTDKYHRQALVQTQTQETALKNQHNFSRMAEVLKSYFKYILAKNIGTTKIKIFFCWFLSLILTSPISYQQRSSRKCLRMVKKIWIKQRGRWGRELQNC